MKTHAAMLTASCLFFLLTSCVATETDKDARFDSILARPIATTRPLYLYQRSANRNGDPSRHSLGMSKMIMEDEEKEIIAVLPVGQKVTFERVRKSPQSGGVSERLVGFTVYKNVKYPVSYNLGFAGAEIGWKDAMIAFQ
jgi:hypothetical protein